MPPNRKKPFVQLLSADDDTPRYAQGVLIPLGRGNRRRAYPRHQFTPVSAQPRMVTRSIYVVVSACAALMLAVVGVAGYGMLEDRGQLAAPVVTVLDAETKTMTKLSYGAQPALSQPDVFAHARDELIDENTTFIEVDVNANQLRFFEEGVLTLSTQLQAVGADGSWWETPSGLYEVTGMNERAFSTIGQVYLPWQILFQSNYMIHGVPEYPDGTPAETAVGGVQLSTTKAAELYAAVSAGVPVLFHKRDEQVRDDFVYLTEVPEVDAKQYLIADIESGLVLAASDLEVVLPIASLTKLMTAVIAAEKLNLDGRIKVTSPTFVTSLIPRLEERSSVSTYSLLQLLLVESSNEAAETLAGEVGREEFIAAMNEKARQLGMFHTNFADPSGLSAENVSSVGDLLKLARYIAKDRSFIYEITANQRMPRAYESGEFSGLVNFNEIEELDNFVGGKVGETEAALQTAVSLHTKIIRGEERTIAVIVLGSTDRATAVRDLLQYVTDRYDR